jgi:hypothetical protein
VAHGCWNVRGEYGLAEFVVEDLGVVDDQAVEEGVELFGVDAVGTLLLCR